MGERRPTTVFISYRRDDSAGHAGRLVDALRARLAGRAEVFLDIDGIRPGHDFVEVIRRTIEGCSAVLVVIGPDWLDARDERDGRRLDDPEDFVLLEIESALAAGVPVIPLLVGGAEMPAAPDLPPSIRPLARREALELDDRRFQVDVDELAAILAPPPARRAPGRRGLLAGAGVVALLLAGVVAWLVLRDDGGQTPTAQGVQPVATAGAGGSGTTAAGAAGSSPADALDSPPELGGGLPPTPPPDVPSLPPSPLLDLLPALAAGCAPAATSDRVIEAYACGDGGARWSLVRVAGRDAAEDWIAGRLREAGGSEASWRDTTDIVGRVAYLGDPAAAPTTVLWDYWEPSRADGALVWAVVPGTRAEAEAWWRAHHAIAPAEPLDGGASTPAAPTGTPPAA